MRFAFFFLIRTFPYSFKTAKRSASTTPCSVATSYFFPAKDLPQPLVPSYRYFLHKSRLFLIAMFPTDRWI